MAVNLPKVAKILPFLAKFPSWLRYLYPLLIKNKGGVMVALMHTL